MYPFDVAKFSQLYTGSSLIIYLVISAVNALLIYLSSIKFILVLQQCGYRGRRFFKWLGNKNTPYMSRLMILSILALLFFCVLNMTFEPLFPSSSWATYIGFVSYVLFSIAYIKTESSVNAKIPLKKTKRLVRLCITYVIILAGVTFGLITLCNVFAFIIDSHVVDLLRFCLICGMPMLIPYLLICAYGINEPLERALKRRYIRKAVEKLNSTDVIKIGITGSYAKTSVKEILKTILSQKYRVLATPSSYNTPLGIAITVKYLDNTHDIFIAEMGARSKGDVKELATMVKPKYGVLTGVNEQHLETFGSIETTKDTKFELFENLEEGGVGVFSSDNKNSVELMNRFNGEKYLAGISDEDNLVWATNVVTDEKGMSFTLNIRGEAPVTCSTVLLGRHSVRNICLAAAVAYKIGVSPQEIAMGVNRIHSVGHRLELLPNNKNIVIIDDSYNSNVEGVNAAMEVLDTFKGRKIVLTPGLVELGKIENLANMEFGKLLAKHADVVIVIGKHNAEMIISGLLEGGMQRENIKFASSLNKGNQILNEIVVEGDIVLFENDLPDNYN